MPDLALSGTMVRLENGAIEAAANLLTNPQLAPAARIAVFKVSAVRVEPIRDPATV